MPASAAVGTVTVSKAYVTNVTTAADEVEVTVEDSDLNTGVLQSNETTGFNSAHITPNLGNGVVAANQEFVVRVAKFPILDNTGDGIVNFLDVTVTSTDSTFARVTQSSTSGVVTKYHPFGVNAADGLLTFKNTATSSVSALVAFQVTYTAHDVQTASVTVRSTQDATGFSMLVLETGASTGIFKGKFGTAAATDLTNSTTTATTPRPKIAVTSGSVITVVYNDGGTNRTASVTVETTKPVVSVVTPEHQLSTKTQAVRIIADITDADSTIAPNSITFEIVSTAPATVLSPTAPVVNAITGGYRAESTVNVPAGETTVVWRVTAKDKAGNIGNSDRNTSNLVADDYDFRVDTVAPTLASGNPVRTGQHFASGAPNVTASEGKNTSIRVVFNEFLDGTTIQAADFRVNNAAPTAAEWFAADASSVYLTVAAMASDAKPSVSVIGSSLSDKAGNLVAVAGLSGTATDNISPTIVVSLSQTLSKEVVTIDVSSDETLLAAPQIVVAGMQNTLSGSALISTNLFRATLTATTRPSALNVKVTATDTSGNAKTAGTGAITASGAIKVEIDNGIPNPVIGVLGSGDPNTSFSPNPFLEIDWSGEGREYGLLAGKDGTDNDDYTNTVADIATNLDTKSNVTLSAVTLTRIVPGGTNVVEDVAARINKESAGKFLLSNRDLPVANYELKLTGTDDAGNAKTITKAFSVKVRPDFSLTMRPGWNLVSLPNNPANTDINTVIKTTNPIKYVLTYDPTVPGSWLTATRAEDGTLAGTLTHITANRAYWMYSTSFQALNVTIPVAGGGVATTLPTVNLVKGWNLLPVLDVTGTKTAGQALEVTAATYMSGLSPTRIYDYNELADTFSSVVPATAFLVVGQGYWVYLNAAGTLVP
ncbi:MAG: hypothetical protein FJ319_06985 [SAR202 cluster bacterium]|nr:hypothetical protein [SAR202 cluster bacterium]